MFGPFFFFLITLFFFIVTHHRLAAAAPRALRRFEASRQQAADQGARPLLHLSAVAGMMLALTFTCRALLVFLLTESVQSRQSEVQSDRTAVRPELFITGSI